MILPSLVLALAANVVPTLALTLPRSFAVSFATEIEKPSVQPPFSESKQDKHLRADLPRHLSTYRKWSKRWIPKACVEEAQYIKLSPSDFVVRDIWYDDCAAAWTVCRHIHAEESWEFIVTVRKKSISSQANYSVLTGTTDPGPSPRGHAAIRRQ